MHTFAAAGAGFLLAVLWFDLMFDVQTRRYTGDLPPEVLASISAYYRRVTTEAYPMNRLVALVMVLTLVAIVAQIVEAADPWWAGWGSLALAGNFQRYRSEENGAPDHPDHTTRRQAGARRGRRGRCRWRA